MSGSLGFGICCCDGVGDACPTTGIPQFNVTTYSLQNTLLFFTLTGTTCGDIVAGTYVLDYDSEDANWYYFKRNVTLISRPLNIEVDVSKTMSGGYHTTIAVRVFDATNGFQFADIDGYMYEQILTGKTFCGCVHSFNVSVFYSARRWLPADVPDTLTMSVSGEFNGTLTECTSVNGTFTADLLSSGGTVDGFVYVAEWNGLLPISVDSNALFVFQIRTLSPPIASDHYLATGSNTVLVGRSGGTNCFLAAIVSVAIEDVDRSVDSPLTAADFVFEESASISACDPCLAGGCFCTAELTGFSE